MKSLKFHRFLSLALALCMLCTMLSGLSLTAFADDTYTVSFSTPTGIVAPAAVTVNAGASFALPTGIASPETGYTFVGWYENPIQNEVSLQNEDKINTDLYKPTSDITLFACYKRAETIPGYYEKTTGEPASSGNKYLIVYESADKTIAFTNKPGTAGTAASHYNTSGNYVSVTIENNQIALTSDVEAIALFIRRVSTGHFSIKLPNGKYIAYNSGTDLKLFDAENSNNSIEFDALGYAVISDVTTTDRIFSYNPASNRDAFRFYKDDADIYLYEKHNPRTVYYYTTNPSGEEPCAHQNTTWVGAVEASCTTPGFTGNLVCDDCGATIQAGTEIPAPGHNYGAFTSNNNGTHSKTCSRCSDVITETCDTIGTNGSCSVCGYQAQSGSCNHNFVDNICTQCGLNLTQEFRFTGAELSLNNLLDFRYNALLPSEFADPYVVFTFNGVDTTVTDYITSDDGRLQFIFSGINPQCMGDNISATLHASYKGEDFTTTQETYSVRQYCINRLKKDDTSDELRKLVTSLLNYGSYSQAYMGYNTTAYVGNGSDIQNPIYTTFTELSGYSASFDGEAATDTFWISNGLTLSNGVAINYRFYASNISDLSITLSMNGRTKTYTDSDFASVDTNVYEISFNEIQPDEFDSTIIAVFERDDEQVGNTLFYSVNAYIQSKQNDSNKKLKNIVRALSNYGICVESYLNSLAN